MTDVIDEAHGVARGTVTPPVAAPAPFRSRGALEYELKFGMEHRSVVALRRWLGAMCLPDPRFPIGTVCSIYYDTPGFHHLRENFNGDYLQSKVRLRWYLDHIGRPAGRFSRRNSGTAGGATRSGSRCRTKARGLQASLCTRRRCEVFPYGFERRES